MTTLTGATLAAAGIDAVALKPTEVDVSRATGLDIETLAIDYEGASHVPETDTIERLASTADVRVTTPVRADGFDPLGDDSGFDALPAGAGHVLVAGHSAYLSEDEAERAVAPRLRAPSTTPATPGSVPKASSASRWRSAARSTNSSHGRRLATCRRSGRPASRVDRRLCPSRALEQRGRDARRRRRLRGPARSGPERAA